jgi:multiple sugar transport system ATP-binding protein
MAEVGIERLHKTFGETAVLNDISMQIHHGEFMVFVGPSGCGKTTLLRSIAGLEKPSAGRVTIGGDDVTRWPPARRGVSMVFQSYALYPHMTVRENIAFGLKVAKVPKADIAGRVKDAAGVLQIEHLLDRRPKELSGGQRQRVAIGRSIVRQPKAFLFDEPLSNLDAELRVQMRVELVGLHDRLGATMIYVTHDQVEAMTMADRIVVMRDGIVEQVGSPLDLYDAPANLFVAGFIGSPAMNFIPGRLRRSGAASAVETADGTRIELGNGVAAQDGDEIVFGIRPEHFVRAAGGLNGRIDVIEPTGADTILYATVAGTQICAVFDERVGFRPGDAITLAPRQGAVHVFDPANGRHL